MKTSIIDKIRSSDWALTKKGKIINNTEVHALGIGVYHGLTPHKKIPEDVLEENQDVRREPHYAKGGFAIGVSLKTIAVAGLGGVAL